jgi:Ankyrin repeats (3 copies)
MFHRNIVQVEYVLDIGLATVFLGVAAERGDVSFCKDMISAHADVCATNSAALRYAAKNGYSKIVELLLNAGADPYANNGEAIKWAMQNGHASVINELTKTIIYRNDRAVVEMVAGEQSVKVDLS